VFSVFRVKEKGNKSFLRLIPVSGLFSIEFSEENISKEKEEQKPHDRAYYIS